VYIDIHTYIIGGTSIKGMLALCVYESLCVFALWKCCNASVDV